MSNTDKDTIIRDLAYKFRADLALAADRFMTACDDADVSFPDILTAMISELLTLVFRTTDFFGLNDEPLFNTLKQWRAGVAQKRAAMHATDKTLN